MHRHAPTRLERLAAVLMLRRVAENLSAEKCAECQAITAPLRVVVSGRADCHEQVTSLSACSAHQHLHAAVDGLPGYLAHL
jgi:hypothetical protein